VFGIDQEPRTRSDDRRSSLMDFATYSATPGRGNLATNTMVTEYVVPRESKMITLSCQGYRVAKKCYEEYRNTSLDQTKRFVHFMDKEVLMALVASEQALRTELGNIITNNSIHHLDTVLLKVIARALRPLSYKQYVKAIQGNVKMLTPTKGRIFKGYIY
jgi:hypothetical protein